MIRDGKYARVERERRFLLAAAPATRETVAEHRITDRYLTGTRLRLRRVEPTGGGESIYKLTQKVPGGSGHVQGLITNTYLSKAEYGVLTALPADVLSKTRLTMPPFGVDVFDPPLNGLVLAEVEFTDDKTAAAFPAPDEAVAEVTEDHRFTGGSLVRTGRDGLLNLLAAYGLRHTPT